MLDGGIGAWEGPLETGSEPRPAATFTARPWPQEALASADDAADPANAVIDARQHERYVGAGPDPVDPRPGHIPGARSLPAREHLGPDGRLLERAELRERFAAAGVDGERPVVSYCGSGVTACHNLIVLEHAGLGTGRLYAGSWSQWSRLRPPGRHGGGGMSEPLSATELVAAYRAGERSPVEEAEAALGRIEERDGELNAFCLVDAERGARPTRGRPRRAGPAASRPARSTACRSASRTCWSPRAGRRCAARRAIDPAGPWEDDAPVVASLRRSGAVLPGKTTTPELGWKGVTDSALTGVTRNPWDPRTTPGGSSGGSSAALAAGMVPLALGTDGGGSIRIPCAFCGLPGLKPTFGRVPAWPASPFGPVSHVGPMARTVADLALLLDVIAAPDARDWQQLPPAARSFGAGLEDGVAGLRIAFSPELGYAAVDPEIAGLVARAAFAFAELGAHVEMADPGFADPRGTFDVLWSTGAARAIADAPEHRTGSTRAWPRSPSRAAPTAASST